MATTRVGVRQLKNDAPRLVRRAAGGERIVVTHHGRAVAALVPAGEVEDAAEDSERMAAWRVERAAFERLLPRLAARYQGQYVAIRGGKVVGAATSPDELFAKLWPGSRGRAFYLGRVGSPPPVIDLPGFTVE